MHMLKIDRHPTNLDMQIIGNRANDLFASISDLWSQNRCSIFGAEDKVIGL
jgi:hypothetical protein